MKTALMLAFIAALGLSACQKKQEPAVLIEPATPSVQIVVPPAPMASEPASAPTQ